MLLFEQNDVFQVWFYGFVPGLDTAQNSLSKSEDRYAETAKMFNY